MYADMSYASENAKIITYARLYTRTMFRDFTKIILCEFRLTIQSVYLAQPRTNKEYEAVSKNYAAELLRYIGPELQHHAMLRGQKRNSMHESTRKRTRSELTRGLRELSQGLKALWASVEVLRIREARQVNPWLARNRSIR